ncbi:MAG: NAD(P)-dependent oxidoreductase [Candidatus Pacebacteria bacterium]|nr:NAD(P)-dependent oxidoreductase [Candidatus Paceibacterota bacterium]
MQPPRVPDSIRSNRLSAETYAENFSDLHPLLSEHQAFVEADRCYYCADAPCQTACPTSIDIPAFIREISTENPLGAAKTIFDSNILGGTCARVCPVETLCEQACVREFAEGKPVKIGQLQRYATDAAMAAHYQPFQRAAATGKKIAIVGAGPAGLACAHGLAQQGHDIDLFEARDKLGGLTEYGIAAYKVTNDFAQREVEFILSIGGISVKTNQVLGEDIFIDRLLNDYAAVFVAVGLGGVNQLGIQGSDGAVRGIEDAVNFIAKLRQSKNLSTLPIGKNIVVIGGGMTAVDIAVQSKRLGAETVTILYRRSQDEMKASGYEQQLAQTNGVVLRCNTAPVSLQSHQGWVTAIDCVETAEKNGKLVETDHRFSLECDMVFPAIGQVFVPAAVEASGARKLEQIVDSSGRIKVDSDYRTALPKLWAGGDCVSRGVDLTVAAVEAGKIAARSIHSSLSQGK